MANYVMQNSGQDLDKAINAYKNGISKSVAGTLLASGWSAEGTQVLSVSGLTAEQNGMISVSPSATAAQRAAARKANLSVTGQAAGTLTVTADGAVPEIDIPVTILLF